MDLNPRQIDAFRLVMVRGSVTAAAQDLRISQPAVSRLVRDLEVRTGLALFERRANALAPTPEAYMLLAEVERYASGLASLGAFVEALRDRRRGSLSVVAMPALAMSFVPRFVAGFVEGRNLGEVMLHGMPSHLVIDAVLRGQFEIGIAAAPPERPGLMIEPIRASAVVALPAGHRLAMRAAIRSSDLENERVITLAEPTILPSPIASSFGRIARERIAVTTPLSGIACNLVAAGVGIAIVDPFSVAEYIAHGVVAVPFMPKLDVRIAIVTNSHRRPSALSREFAAAFLAHAEVVAANAVAGARLRSPRSSTSPGARRQGGDIVATATRRSHKSLKQKS